MNEIRRLTDIEAAYIAGLLDGEGCIMLSKSSRLRELRKTPTYILRVRIKMTDGDLIRWLHATIGGRFYREKKKRSNRWREQYEWSCVGKSAVKFLGQVYPYLKTKRLQAEVGFKYAETFSPGQKLSDKMVSRREELRGEILYLNRRPFSSAFN